MKVRRILIGVALVLLVASPLREPQLLAFPYQATVGADHVYSTAPFTTAQLRAMLDRANALVAASPIHDGAEGRNIYLTDGGWRWTWLAGTSRGAFALTRPFAEAVIVNRSSLAGDRVFNGAAIAGTRTLSGVIAHEKCHGMLRRRFGMIRERTVPTWLNEGYCDYVARESSLTDAQAKTLEAAGAYHPAIAYLRGREKVAGLLAANGGDVDKLFGGAK